MALISKANDLYDAACQSYDNNNARRRASSSVITEASSSALSQYQDLSSLEMGLSMTDFRSEDGISLATGLHDLIKKGIPLISLKYLEGSNSTTSVSNQSMNSQDESV